MDIFDRDYYERGIETGKSCYQNYRWIPELTIPLAMTIIDYLGIKRGQTILDLGCAKGYLVKAFRLLYRQAWGLDISEYAIRNVDPEVKEFCSLGNSLGCDTHYDICVAKDVFEHIPESILRDVIQGIKSDILFAVMPLGEDGSFNAPANNMDITHVTCQPAVWWSNVFTDCGWRQKRFAFQVKGIKDSYYEKYQDAHGFFVLEKRGTK
uniref:Putative methyltransferase n=1 Tax=viral metagenome TaxID=1070528 RepID=A0A6M3LA84_9ZZZZ